MIDRNHPAVEAAMKSTALDTLLIDLRPRLNQRMRVAHLLSRFINAALPYLTVDDLRDTPAGRALMAEGKSLGWDDAIGELRKGQGMHRALAGTLSTRKPNYEETPDE